MHIGKLYMFPKILEESGLSSTDLVIDEEIWPQIIRPLGFDPGIRSLQRTIRDIVRRVARSLLEKKIATGAQFRISKENIHEFLPAW